MEQVQSVYRYAASKTQNGIKIDYQASPLPNSFRFGSAGLFAMFAMLYWLWTLIKVAFSNDPSVETSSFWYVAAWAAIGYFLFPAIIERLRVRGGSFIVTPGAVIVRDKQYARADIRDLRVVNAWNAGNSHPSNQGGQNFTVIGGTGVAGATAALGAGLANAANQTSTRFGEMMGEGLAKVKYKLMIVYGTKNIQLAKNLNSEDAAILHEATLKAFRGQL